VKPESSPLEDLAADAMHSRLPLAEFAPDPSRPKWIKALAAMAVALLFLALGALFWAGLRLIAEIIPDLSPSVQTAPFAPRNSG